MSGLYRVDKIVGRGAHATVCIARKNADGQPVALKVMRPDLVNDASLLARMRDEARLLSTLDHPDIVRVTALHEFEGRPVLEMEYVDGVSLARILRDSGQPVPTVEALEITRRVALALDFAYRHPSGPRKEPMRIIHRDIKPDNVLVSRSGGVKLVDFGIAKADFVGRSAKTLGIVTGSHGFEAPERRLGMDSPATDVYALGVSLFILLTTKTLMLSRDGVQRAAELERQTARLGEDLHDAGALRKLLGAMVSFDAESRPTARKVADTIAAMLLQERTPDLAAWTRTVPWALETQVPAAEHPEWPTLEFLETEVPTPQRPRSPGEASAALRKLLTAPDWTKRLPEVERVLHSCAERVDAPLLEILGRARVPWWRFWTTPARPEELEAALWLLADRPSNDAIKAAKELTTYSVPSVSRSAKMVLERARAG